MAYFPSMTLSLVHLLYLQVWRGYDQKAVFQGSVKIHDVYWYALCTQIKMQYVNQCPQKDHAMDIIVNSIY